MKKYVKSWNNRLESEPQINWSSLSNPMCLKIKEDQKSDLFIAASLEFSGLTKRGPSQKPKGSLYYKIEVNGEPLVQYHVPNTRGNQHTLDVNLQGRTEIEPGEHTVEVFYKVSENGSWDLMQYQNQRMLSVLSYPKD